MDDAGTRDTANPGQLARTMVEQGVDQRTIEIASRWMDDKAGRLVDDEQMVVLEQDRQRDVLRLVVGGRRFRHRDTKRFIAFDLQSRVPKGSALSFHGAAS